MSFAVDQALIDGAGETLQSLSDVSYLIGGSCSGKSTIGRHLAQTRGLRVIDMDTLVFGGFMSRYTPERHPASHTWFTQQNGLAWVLSLTASGFDGLLRATNAEVLDLLAEDFRGNPPAGPLLLEGGFSHPAVLVQAVPKERITCIDSPIEDSERIWKTTDERRGMRDAILALPEGDKAWRWFLELNRNLTQTLVRECGEAGIRIVPRQPGDAVEETARRVGAGI